MSKELWIMAHEELIQEAMLADPTLTECEAHDQTADAAWERMAENMARLADAYHARAKDEPHDQTTEN